MLKRKNGEDMKNKKTLALTLLSALFGFPTLANADYNFVETEKFQFGIGGYARVYSGKLESTQYNTVLKAEPKISASYKINDDLSLKGKLAYRIIRNDRFADQKVSKVQDAYATIESKTYGALDIGKLRSVAYNLHAGTVDVSPLDINDSDIPYFYETPKNFYAPQLTHLYTDSRDLKVSYTSPEMQGVTFGISAVQSEDKKADTITPYGSKIDHGKGIITAIQYKTDLTNTIWLNTSLGIAFYQNNRFWINDKQTDANHREYSLGSKIGWKNLSFAIAYKRILFPDKIALKDSSAFSTGIAYNQGKYGVSLSWLHSQAELVEKDKYNHIMLSNKYDFTNHLTGFVSMGQLQFSNNKGLDDKRLFGIMGVEVKL